ncbi:MarR family transcriptional regulator [Thioclava sp. BHET1]|uniref:MarR family transcriptional regulator n=1 Tax=Thioclava dalianensis TaxID=1185766 RepID=A0A074TQ30_9RHOB|nr:MarR family transcriptional regulator [Thioclava dalianensis]KEP71123.1 MarR family transcriptional regulator [Thioclava dalianensis]TMV93229.1 MarR family transcriptional regulator [Thioclava sp. BHET1]SFN24425.1 DNA-binding transcriptional regulator, MarR family [Thioclava dalianensis]
MTKTPSQEPHQPESLYADRRMKRDWPFYWVSRVNALYIQELEKKLKPLGLDMARWRILMSLYEEEHLSVSEIAEYSIIKLNTATKIVQRMIVDGLVITRVRPNDGRVTEVRLTPAGDHSRRLARAEADRILNASFVGFTLDEVALLNQLLERVHDRLRGS